MISVGCWFSVTPPKQYIFFPRLANVKFDFGNNIGRNTCINCYNPLTRETFYMEDYPTAKRLGDYEVEDLSCVVTEQGVLYSGGGNYIYHDFPSDHFDSDDSFDELEERIVRKDFYCYDNDHNKWLSMSPDWVIHNNKVMCTNTCSSSQKKNVLIINH
jgi:hypothetical protein